MRTLRVLSTIVLLAGCAAPSAADEPTSNDDELRGAKSENGFQAAGYLVHGASADAVDLGQVACGATLVAPNVVVTAAHCLLEHPNDVFFFGTGNVAAGKRVRVARQNVHPRFHFEKQGAVDIDHALRKFDIATLILASPIEGVTPAALPNEAPPAGCNLRSVGYTKDGDAAPTHVSAPACTVVRIQLGDDPIFEVHPTKWSAICMRDGDEGSAVFDAKTGVLRGVFVGSVTQAITDCKRGIQFLNGYESAFGYRDFINEGIKSASR